MDRSHHALLHQAECFWPQPHSQYSRTRHSYTRIKWMDNICMLSYSRCFNHLALFMHGQFCQYLILLLCNTSNTCLSIDPTVLDRFLEMPKNPIATLAWVTLLSWLLLHRPWWCWRCLLWNANDTMLIFKMIIVDDKILIVIRCSKTVSNFHC